MMTSSNKHGFFNHQTFTRDKPPGTLRVFCLGGSTTYGRPFSDETAFSGWLRQLLPKADPAHNWEVINAGGIRYASYRVALLMEELVAYEPDLFIVYSGHNEFLEESTYKQVRHMPAAVRAVAPTARLHPDLVCTEDDAGQDARESGTTLIDYPALLTQRSLAQWGHAIPGEESFLDHVHPTVDAHRWLALAILEQMTSMQLLPADSGPDPANWPSRRWSQVRKNPPCS